MTISTDAFKINLNQNLWGLVAAYCALGFAEHYQLCTLFWFSAILAAVMTLSMVATTGWYTFNYCKNKAK